MIADKLVFTINWMLILKKIKITLSICAHTAEELKSEQHFFNNKSLDSGTFCVRLGRSATFSKTVLGTANE